MIKTVIKLQDLRKRIYLKSKAEPKWRFWGMYIHVCKMETLEAAYIRCKQNKGRPGEDGITFEEIERKGVQNYLKSIQKELLDKTYYPAKSRRKAIPKGNGKTRILSIPNVKDRIVQSALKLILEPIVEADFCPGSYGSRPKCNAEEAVEKVGESLIKGKRRVIDVDLEAFYDNIRHHILLDKIGKRISDRDIMHLLKLIMKVNGKKGIAQGSPISPLLSNIYLNNIDKMLEKAIKVTERKPYTHISYARYLDDLVICVENHPKWVWLYEGVKRRLGEELQKLDLPINEEKSKEVNLDNGESFKFLGFRFIKSKTRNKKQGVLRNPDIISRSRLIQKLKYEMRRLRSQPITRVLEKINPILRGWVNYFRIGTSSRCFKYVREWTIKKVRRHLMRQRMRQGFGWNRWSNEFIYEKLGLYSDYRIIRYKKL